MPIRPENRAFYQGAEFRAFRELVRARAGNKCEECHAAAGSVYWTWRTQRDGVIIMRQVRVVCGISHTDHDPRHRNVALARWLCDRCHLAHDRRNNYARSRRLRAALVGQLWLFEELVTAEMPEGMGLREETADGTDEGLYRLGTMAAQAAG